VLEFRVLYEPSAEIVIPSRAIDSLNILPRPFRGNPHPAERPRPPPGWLAQDFEAFQEPPAEPFVAVICQLPDIEPPENEPV
jgi:hypothetical protein